MRLVVRGLCLLLALGSVASCEVSKQEVAAEYAEAPPAPRFAADPPSSRLSEIVVTGARATEISERRIARSHDITLRLPSTEVEAVQKRHLAECSKLNCEILSSSINRADESRIRASVSVRIPPQAFDAFIGILGESPSRITAHSEDAEDKTLAFIEVQKRLEIQTALRDRLMGMLKEPGQKKVEDLVDIETKLADVQTTIETDTAQRNYLLTLTETMAVSVDYVGTTAEAGGLDLSSLEFALTGFLRTIIGSLAMMIDFIAAIIPWLFFLALAVWASRRAYRRWKARRSVQTS